MEKLDNASGVSYISKLPINIQFQSTTKPAKQVDKGDEKTINLLKWVGAIAAGSLAAAGIVHAVKRGYIGKYADKQDFKEASDILDQAVKADNIWNNMSPEAKRAQKFYFSLADSTCGKKASVSCDPFIKKFNDDDEKKAIEKIADMVITKIEAGAKQREIFSQVDCRTGKKAADSMKTFELSQVDASGMKFGDKQLKVVCGEAEKNTDKATAVVVDQRALQEVIDKINEIKQKKMKLIEENDFNALSGEFRAAKFDSATNAQVRNLCALSQLEDEYMYALSNNQILGILSSSDASRSVFNGLQKIKDEFTPDEVAKIAIYDINDLFLCWLTQATTSLNEFDEITKYLHGIAKQ